MSAFSIRNPYFIIVLCLVVSMLGMVGVVGMPVDLFPTINLPQVVVATFYSGMPPQDIEAEHHFAAGALLHAGERHRSHRIAFHARRQHDPRVLSAGHQRGCRCHAALQSGAGRSEAPSAGHAAAGGSEIRRVQPARLPGGGERRRA